MNCQLLLSLSRLVSKLHMYTIVNESHFSVGKISRRNFDGGISWRNSAGIVYLSDVLLNIVLMFCLCFVEYQVTLSEFLRENDAEGLQTQVEQLADNIDHPPLMVGWSLERILAALANAAFQAEAPAPPFALILPSTEPALKAAILNYVRVPGSAPPLGNCVLPCTISEFCSTLINFTRCEFDSWFQYQCTFPGGVTPIGRLYVPQPRSNTVVGFNTNAAAGANLWQW